MKVDVGVETEVEHLMKCSNMYPSSAIEHSRNAVELHVVLRVI